jgi:hypothetical protein
VQKEAGDRALMEEECFRDLGAEAGTGTRLENAGSQKDNYLAIVTGDSSIHLRWWYFPTHVNRRNVSLRFPIQSLALEKDRFDTENTQGLLTGRDYFMQAFKDQKARRMVNASVEMHIDEDLPDATEQFLGISSKLDGMPSEVAEHVVETLADGGFIREAPAVKKVKRAIQPPPMTGSKNIDEKLLIVYDSVKDGTADETIAHWPDNQRMMRKTVAGCVDVLLATKEAGTLVDLPLISEFRLGIATPAPTTFVGVVNALKLGVKKV